MGNFERVRATPPFEGKLLLNSAILTAEKPRPPPHFEETLTEVGYGYPGLKNGGSLGQLSSQIKDQLEEIDPPPP